MWTILKGDIMSGISAASLIPASAASRVQVPTSFVDPDNTTSVTCENVETLIDIVAKRAALGKADVWVYARALPTSELTSKKRIVKEYAKVGALAGATAGAALGMAAGPFSVIASPAGAGSGLLLGTAAGAGYGAYVVHKQLKKEFPEWQRQQSQQILKDFKDIFKDHPALDVCIDPITQEPMIRPAHCACPETQHTLDYSTFEDLAQKRRPCPLSDNSGVPASRVKIIRMEDIHIDYRSMGVVNVAYAKFITVSATTAKLSPLLMQGVQAIVKDLEAEKTFFFHQERSSINEQLIKEKDPDKMIELTLRLAVVTRLLYRPVSSSAGASSSSSSSSSHRHA